MEIWKTLPTFRFSSKGVSYKLFDFSLEAQTFKDLQGILILLRRSFVSKYYRQAQLKLDRRIGGGGKGEEKAQNGIGEKGKGRSPDLGSNSTGQPDRAQARTNGTKCNDFPVGFTSQASIMLLANAGSINTRSNCEN